MSKLRFVCLLASSICMTASADDYIVKIDQISDLERLRALVESCDDIGILESYRSELDAAYDYEKLRNIFETVSLTRFSGCPSGMERKGVEKY